MFSVAFSRRPLLASSTNSGKVPLWDPATGEMVGALEAHTAAASGVAFSPDGSLLASNGLDGRVVLTMVEQLSPQGVIDEAAGGGFAGSIAFAPDGATLATGTYGGAIGLWDAVGVRQVGALSGDARPLHSLAYRPDGAALAAASVNGQVRVWDVTSGGLLALLEGYTDGLLSLAYSPGGESLATGGRDGLIRLYDRSAQPGSVLENVSPMPGGQTLYSPVSALAFIPMAASWSGYDGTLRWWDVALGADLTAVTAHTRGLTGLAYHPGGQVVISASSENAIRLWSRAVAALSGDPLAELPLGDEPAQAAVWHVAASPDGALVASAHWDNTVRLWDGETGESLAVLEGHHHAVYGVAFSPDGARLASASRDGTIRLWDVRDARGGVESLAVLVHEQWVRCLAFSPDGRLLASGSDDGAVRLWDVSVPRSGANPLARLDGHTDFITAVSFSPDGTMIASTSLDGTLRLWAVATPPPA